PSMLTEFPMGRVFEDAKVLSVVDYGVFVKLREGVEGMIRTSDVQEPEGGKIKPGDKLKCEVSSIDTIDRRLFLTMKNVGAEKPTAADTSGKKKKGGGTAKDEDDRPVAGTIGDLIRE